jgi:hypothetical protein
VREPQRHDRYNQIALRRADAVRNRERILRRGGADPGAAPSATLTAIAAGRGGGALYAPPPLPQRRRLAGGPSGRPHRRPAWRRPMVHCRPDAWGENDRSALMPSKCSTSCHRPCCPNSWLPRRSASPRCRWRCTYSTSTAPICCTWPGRDASGTRRRPRPGPGRAARRPQRLELCRKAGLSTRATGRRPSRARARGQPRRPLAKEHALQPASRVGRRSDSSKGAVGTRRRARCRLTRKRRASRARCNHALGITSGLTIAAVGRARSRSLAAGVSYSRPRRRGRASIRRAGRPAAAGSGLAEDSLTLRWAVC